MLPSEKGMSTSTRDLCPMAAGDTSGWQWLRKLPRPLAHSFGYSRASSPSYQPIPTASPDRTAPLNLQACSRTMMYGILCGALVVGGAGSDWYFSRRYERGEYLYVNQNKITNLI